MTTPTPTDLDPALAAAVTTIQTIVDAAGITFEQAAEAIRSGTIDPGLTFGQALDEAETLMTKGTRVALDPYGRVVRVGMPGTCACICEPCLDVVERHRAIPGTDEREPVPCPCVEAGRCDCVFDSDEVPAKSCLDPCPVLADVPVAAQGTEAAIVRKWVRNRAQRRELSRNLRRAAKERAQRRAGGEHAVEQYDALLTKIYKSAKLRSEVREALIEAIPSNSRPQRAEGRGITIEQFRQVIEVAWTGGNDPDLDGLLVLFEVCTGARREGILELRTDSLDVAGLQVDLWEKFNSTRWQPIMRDLLGMLIDHVLDRHLRVVDPARWDRVTVDDILDGKVRLPSAIPIFHYRPRHRDGVLVPHPVSRKRFNTLYERIQETLPWADQHGLHGHDLRRTGSSWIERRFGRGVAQAWLAHADDVTGLYTRGTKKDVRAATEWLGELIFGTNP